MALTMCTHVCNVFTLMPESRMDELTLVVVDGRGALVVARADTKRVEIDIALSIIVVDGGEFVT